MSNAVSAQHPAVLRSSYLHLRVLLAIAAIAIVGLTVAVVVLAINNGGSTVTSAARATSSATRVQPAVAVGPNPDQRGLQPSLPRATSSATRVQPAVAVGPNPDQRGLSPSVPQPGPIVTYTGQY